MREILFRGKRKDNNEWVYGHYYAKEDKDFIVAIETYKEYEVIPETVGQLRYKNNQLEIFDEDFVRVWGGECWYGIWEYDKIILIIDCYSIINICEAENVRVIGNKWDNPELLEEEK